jgi:hypothetical protein
MRNNMRTTTRRSKTKAKHKYTPEEIRDACADLYHAAAGCMTPKDVQLLKSHWERACIDCVLEAATKVAESMP